MKLQEKFQILRHQKSALLATNFYNFETLQAVLTAAKNQKTPLILQLTDSSINYMGLKPAVAMARAAIDFFEVEAWIHLDHGGSIELAEACLRAGFDSVMFDGSELPFNENIEKTRTVVAMAKKFGASVEAELGYVAKLGQDSGKVVFTEPDDAKAFVDATGVDTLAVAIGTAHGFYKSEPKLDFSRLHAISEITKIPLVLHGSSGIPDASLQKAIQCGACKINLATELKNIFMKTLKSEINRNENIDLRVVFPPATASVRQAVEEKMKVIALAGPA
jgi:tagatose 1,6-diphosphate aldolase GatY/KbaY